MTRALAAALLMMAGPALGQTAVTDAAARAFVARQEKAWNAGDLTAYFAGYAPNATFTDQAYVGDRPPVPYGTSTLAEARALAAKAMARSKVREVVAVQRVSPGPLDGSVIVIARVASSLETSSKARRLCAVRRQTLITRQGRAFSTGKTDTYYPCPR